MATAGDDQDQVEFDIVQQAQAATSPLPPPPQRRRITLTPTAPTPTPQPPVPPPAPSITPLSDEEWTDRERALTLENEETIRAENAELRRLRVTDRTGEYIRREAQIEMRRDRWILDHRERQRIFMEQRARRLEVNEFSSLDEKIAAMTMMVEATALANWGEGREEVAATTLENAMRKMRERGQVAQETWEPPDEEDESASDADLNSAYGELDSRSLERLITMAMRFEWENADWFIDIGSGFGKPCFHVYLRTGVRCTGLEYIPERVAHANQLLTQMSTAFAADMPSDVDFVEGSLFDEEPPWPYTVYYAYDLLWGIHSKWPARIEHLFLNSERARVLISFLPPESYPRLVHMMDVPVTTTSDPPETYQAHVYVKHRQLRQQRRQREMVDDDDDDDDEKRPEKRIRTQKRVHMQVRHWSWWVS
jgi:SAM-dependent methyltransferase